MRLPELVDKVRELKLKAILGESITEEELEEIEQAIGNTLSIMRSTNVYILIPKEDTYIFNKEELETGAVYKDNSVLVPISWIGL